MLENCKSAQERWGGVNDIIDRWLKERQELLVLYCSLSDISSELDKIARGGELKALCQVMVDYVSAGHFEIYDKLVQEGEEFDDQEGLKKASTLYKVIDATTEQVLDFNDKYQETDDLDTIEADLSRLGECLVQRFEAEDKMIEVLHIAHGDKVA
jgi:regulator of sigma D